MTNRFGSEKQRGQATMKLNIMKAAIGEHYSEAVNDDNKVMMDVLRRLHCALEQVDYTGKDGKATITIDFN